MTYFLPAMGAGHTRQRCTASARSQPRFVQQAEQDGNADDDSRVVQVCRHSDYPESVLHALAQPNGPLAATHAERGPSRLLPFGAPGGNRGA